VPPGLRGQILNEFAVGGRVVVVVCVVEEPGLEVVVEDDRKPLRGPAVRTAASTTATTTTITTAPTSRPMRFPRPRPVTHLPNPELVPLVCCLGGASVSLIHCSLFGVAEDFVHSCERTGDRAGDGGCP